MFHGQILLHALEQRDHSGSSNAAQKSQEGSGGHVFGWDGDPWLLLLQPVDRAARNFLMEGGTEILRRMVSVPLKQKKIHF